MNPNFLRPLADSKNYPVPKINMLPSEQQLTANEVRKLPENCISVEHMFSARGLLSVVGFMFKGMKVLIPSYHCPAMVEPFLYHECAIEFYSVNEKLEFNEAELMDKMQTADVILGVRYFGFLCGMDRLKSFAEKTDTFMVEDLAHSAFVVRVFGDIAVTSLTKFYPIKGGGELFITNSDYIKDCRSTAHRLQLSGFYVYFNKLLCRIKSERSSNHFRYFNPKQSHRSLAKYDKFILNHYNHSENVKKRRENYQALVNAFDDLSFAKPLFPLLEDKCVPYVFPLLLKDEKYFELIRLAGIPLYRWEEMVDSGCEVSLDFRKLLVQLPCHQDLKPEDLTWIIMELKNIDQKNPSQD